MRFWNQYSRVLKQAGEGDGSGGTETETEENGQGSEGGGDSRSNEPELAEFKFGGNTYNIPRELAQGFGKLSAEFRTASSKLKTLEEAAKEEHPALKELQEKLQQLELEKLPEKEREAARLGVEIKKLSGVIEAEKRNKERYESLFREKSINTELYSALSKHNLYDQNQALLLLKAISQPTVIENKEDGSFKVFLKLDVGDGAGVQELEPEEAAAKWLALPTNANLLKSNLIPGSGTSVKGGRLTTTGQVAYKRSDLAKPEVRQERLEKMKAGIQTIIVD
ncbi:hypothetical protein [Leptospira santarosai]|uniref:Gam-like protein n=1 Tax=Leptospira santarosai TaxID=28183 RepID=A0AB73LKC9_9LEPT|nr:hypothetical protein [Leptospira santarosai]AVV51451.1 Uncharacterized protein XB17_02874 [Leptospira santarosai]MDO6395553.1 hypothetical protein [Leptospira santarosai]OLY65184.1 hypothetical protein BWD11_04575 [Leptospira santarosai serovar Grippotyphosa]ONF77681.1 hypothetical protein BWD12_15005 [Leptospira santarosai serovar Bananal]ONF90225.1 hypothetical protein BWD14_19780 [Leptospira santarosai]